MDDYRITVDDMPKYDFGVGTYGGLLAGRYGCRIPLLQMQRLPSMCKSV